MPVTFGDYLLYALLGAGAYARVFRAAKIGSHGFRKIVAIKALDPVSIDSETALDSFLDEGRIGGHLRHRNIVETYELVKIGAQHCIIIEYVDGWTLTDLLLCTLKKREYFPTTVIIDILYQICAGLAAAHDLVINGVPQNVVHRDLKPSNILITRRGEVKIADFGIAMFQTRQSPKTEVGIARGTPYYMSPEQVRGRFVDMRSDIFALGSIFYELCILKHAFYAKEMRDVLHAILDVNPPEMTETLREYQPDLAWMLGNCLAASPSSRYDHVGLMVDDLKLVRGEMVDGPSLQDWVESNLDQLPAEVPDDDFGEDGPPPAIALTTEFENASIFVKPLTAPAVEAVAAPPTAEMLTRAMASVSSDQA